MKAKKVMLIVLLLVVCGGCFAADKPEIKVGQVWKRTFNGSERTILEVGEKYVVFTYSNGTSNGPEADTKEEFRKDHELVPQFTIADAIDWGITSNGNIFVKDPPQAKKKPYLHKNPTNDHWICSKHGDLDKDKGGADIMVFFTTSTRATIHDMTYCYECYWETQIKLINQHIAGVKEND